MPDTIFACDPSARRTPPTMSICHNFHRPRPLPPPVVTAATLAGLWDDQPVTDQAPVDRRPPRQRHDAVLGQPGGRWCVAHTRDVDGAAPRSAPRPAVVSDADTTPAATTDRSTRPAMPGVALQPLVHRLPRHPVPARDVCDGRAVKDLFDRCQTFHQPQLHQHDPALPCRTRRRSTRTAKKRAPTNRRRKCQAGTGATVAQLPEPRPETVTHRPEPPCPACTGTAHVST